MYDLAVIGGGVNGCGIARDAAGRGLSVLLVEKGDLAGGTSSASTKLVHGGLRYLEHYEFRLVAAALAEREVLWQMAPHIIWPLRFVLPHHASLRPAWMIRLGLALYDHLGGRRLLPKSRAIRLNSDPAGRPLRPCFARAFEYSDCWVDDARLVVLNAVDAAQRGADIRVKTELVRAEREADHWVLALHGEGSGETSKERAHALVNAAGPWVNDVIGQRLRRVASGHARLVKGSHIVVAKLFSHDRAYIFQNSDGRIVFAIPYEGDFTLIGTTDVEFTGDPASVAISKDEVSYLCDAASVYFSGPVSPGQVVWSYSGVRALVDDGERADRITRDFTLDLDAPEDGPPVLHVFGGKITTYRRLAEEALSKLGPWLGPTRPPWTKGAALPGGDFPVTGFESLVADLARDFGFLPPTTLRRLARVYGTRVRSLLEGCHAMAELGQCFGADLYEREVAWLMDEEWATTADDILWRRSKLGLRFSVAETKALASWLADRRVKWPAEPPPSR